MEIFFTVILAIGTLLYVMSPFRFADAGGRRRYQPAAETWNTMPQLELDKELGKIDEQEYEELKQRTRPDLTVRTPIEAIISGVRAARKLDRSLETEVLIARQRKNRKSQPGQK